MYEPFYGLREKPFALTPDPRYLFLSPAHREALDHLVYGVIQREGFIAISGDIGTGKTTLCRALLERLDSRLTRTALILNPSVSMTDLLRAILTDFGVTPSGTTRQALIDELNGFLLDVLARRQTAVLILDEAQNLSPDVLEQIRLLSNLETARDKLVQIVLTGQLGLLDLLASPRLSQLNQRVTVRYQLRPLSRAETAEYVAHRLLVAGSHGGVRFTRGALAAAYRYSRGVPRLINIACDRALLQGFVDQSPVITRRMVSKGTASLDGGAGIGPAGIRWAHQSRTARRRRLRWAVAALLLAGLGFAGGWAAARGLTPEEILRPFRAVEALWTGEEAGATPTPAAGPEAAAPATGVARTAGPEHGTPVAGDANATPAPHLGPP